MEFLGNSEKSEEACSIAYLIGSKSEEALASMPQWLRRPCYLLRLRGYKRKYVEIGVFRKGVSHFERKFLTERSSSTNHYWCQKTRMIAISCGIKISAAHCLVLSQSMHACDRQTDGQTELRQLMPR